MLGNIYSLEDWSGGWNGLPREVLKKCLDAVLCGMVQWENIGGRWIVELDDLGGVF